MSPTQDEQRRASDHEVQFHVAEYASLHGEIRELITEARTLERQVLFATGAVWTWLAVNDAPAQLQWAWFIPVLFSVGGAFRALALKRAVENIALYIQKLEAKLAAKSLGLDGWESFRRRNPAPEGFLTSGVMQSAHVFWAFLILSTTLLPVFLRLGFLD